MLKKINKIILKIRDAFLKIFKHVYNNMYREIVLFCKKTSIHGFKHIINEGTHYLEKCFWIVIISSFLFFAGKLAMIQYNRYLTNPTVVSIRKDFREWTTIFPAITICPNEFVSKELADDYIKEKWNVSEGEPKYMKYFDFVQYITSVTFRRNIREFWKYESYPEFQNIDLMSIVAAVSPEINVKTFSHNNQHQPLWETIITEMGVCKTYNSIFSRYQSIRIWKRQKYDNNAFHTRRDDREKLLSCSYYKDEDCYVSFDMANFTGMYFVHSPYEIAEETANPIDLIDEGRMLDAIYRTLYIQADSSIRSLTVLQRKCKYPDEPVSSTLPGYSNAICQMECRTRMALAFCGCRPFFYLIGDGKPCDVAGMACIGRNMEILINLPPNLVKCKCLPQCTEMNYIPHQIKITQKNMSDILFDEEGAVKYTLQLPKIMMHKTQIFTLRDLIASFGGFGALFMGMSFLSLVEFTIFIFRLCGKIFLCAFGKIKRRSSQTSVY